MYYYIKLKGFFGNYTVASNKMNTDETFSLAYCIVYRAERLPKEVCEHILEYMATPANLLKKALRENAEINTEEDIVRVCSKRCEVSKEHKKIAAELYDVHRPVGLWFSQNGTPLNTPISMAVNTLIPRDIMLYMLLNKNELLNEIANRDDDTSTFYNKFYHSRHIRFKHSDEFREELKFLRVDLNNRYVCGKLHFRLRRLTPRLLPEQVPIQTTPETRHATGLRINANIRKLKDALGNTVAHMWGWGSTNYKKCVKKYNRLGVKKLYEIWRRTWDEDIHDILGINNKK